MKNKETNTYTAVISHKRPENINKIQAIVGPATFFVNKGEAQIYLDAGALHVVECGENICQARNKAIEEANKLNLPCIQISDDLRSLKIVTIKQNQRVLEDTTYNAVVNIMVSELKHKNYNYGGVAVTTNRLNYTGVDFSYNKLIVCDLICIMPGETKFDEEMALKEDYDLTIHEIINTGGVVRCNQFLCDFPHRDNKGGANTYRDNKTEQAATDKLYAKWGNLIKKHPTRPGQISLNYTAIINYKGGSRTLF